MESGITRTVDIIKSNLSFIKISLYGLFHPALHNRKNLDFVLIQKDLILKLLLEYQLKI